MAKVYAVWYDNCEQYEDNHTDVVSIHTTYKGAVKKIESIIEKAKKNNVLLKVERDVDPILNGPWWNLLLKIEEYDDNYTYEEAYSIEEYMLEE